MNLYNVATIACDENGDDDRGCTEVAEYRAPLSQDTQGFAADARKHFESLGWRIGKGLGFCLCPSCAHAVAR